MKVDKKVLAHVGAGVAAVILLTFGVVQCKGRQNAQEAKDVNANKIENLKRENVAAKQEVAKLDSLAREVVAAIDEKDAEIEVLNDSIAVLNDSLDITSRKLADCEASKGKRCPVKKPAKKPVAKPQPKPQPKPEPKPVRDTIVIVQQVPVATPAPTAPVQQQLVIGGDNSGNVTINNGGTVNNFNLPADKVVVLDTLRRACEVKVSVNRNIRVIRSR